MISQKKTKSKLDVLSLLGHTSFLMINVVNDFGQGPKYVIALTHWMLVWNVLERLTILSDLRHKSEEERPILGRSSDDFRPDSALHSSGVLLTTLVFSLWGALILPKAIQSGDVNSPRFVLADALASHAFPFLLRIAELIWKSTELDRKSFSTFSACLLNVGIVATYAALIFTWTVFCDQPSPYGDTFDFKTAPGPAFGITFSALFVGVPALSLLLASCSSLVGAWSSNKSFSELMNVQLFSVKQGIGWPKTSNINTDVLEGQTDLSIATR